MDGRRHSVDVPISRTLVALRRVRSLRDPSTHSMTKLIDSFDWETNQDNTFTLGFDGFGSHELYYGSRKCDSDMVDENNMMMKKYHDGYDGKSSNDECDEFLNQNEESENNFGGSRHLKLGNSYKPKDGDVLSLSKSPCLYPIGETQKAGPINFMGSCHQGCGITSCWTRTKKYRETNLVSNDDVLDEQPLLSTGESPFPERPRNFCDKFSESDIVGRLRKICVGEGVDFDEEALTFIAKKSGGSARDAQMMLDQLSLVGKRITVSLVYEVNGVVSNEELLDLLHLALSSDASRTVKRARELMRSRVEPLQLVSQLANLIMDILAGKFPDGVSDATWKLFGMENSEANMNQLSHALKILSQAEKQLRTSKNQTTWLIAALLQLSPSHVTTNARLSTSTEHPPEEETEQNRTNYDRETLESVWSGAIGICTPHAFRKFLDKHGKLVDLRLVHGTTIAELEFDHPDCVSRAEQSWKVIAAALQLILGHNVELRINLSNNETTKQHPKSKGHYFGLFFCSQSVRLKKSPSRKSNDKSENPVPTLTKFGHGKELFQTIRGKDGNALSVGTSTPRMAKDDRKVCLDSASTEPESKPGRTEKLKFRCWKSAMFALRKAWQPKYLPRDEGLVEYAVHCETAT